MSKLKAQVEQRRLESGDPHALFQQVFDDGNAAGLRRLLQQFPAMRAKINAPLGPFDSPAILHARNPEMLEVLLEAGADLNGKSRWWAGGFGVLHTAEPELARYAIQRGARVDAHAAARLGLLDRLQELLAADPGLVHARGGDGQTPLHFASSVDVAACLLDRGAAIDARDVDHESTPAQYMVRDRQGVARYLVGRGCRTDLLMAAALGDLERVRHHLDADPACIHLRVSEEHFPKANARSGGTIYQWTLGWFKSAHEVAREFGHAAIERLLMERSPAEVQLVAVAWRGDEAAVRSMLGAQPGLAGRLSAEQRRQIAHAARNDDLAAVRAMLVAGLPVDAQGQHGGAPLHWAAFHGNREMVLAILRYGPPLEVKDADFHSTPLGWAMHGSEHGWHRASGDYAGVVEELLAAGARIDPERKGGTEAVQAVLRRHGGKG